MAPRIQEDLSVGPDAIGMFVAAFFASSAALSPLAGRLVERSGWRTTLRIAALLSAAAAGLAIGAREGPRFLVAGMIVAGCANALIHPAANASIVELVPHLWRGRSFGVKQSAVPAASLVAGSALPVLTNLPWQTAFAVLGAGSTIIAVILRPARPPSAAVPASARAQVSTATEPVVMSTLLVLCVGALFATAGANASSTFFVLLAVERGTSLSTAGLLLTTGAILSVGTRLLTGRLADRRVGGHLRVASMMMIVGAAGMVILAFADSVLLLGVGLLLAIGIGWGWNGLMHHGVMRLYETHAPQVSGLLHSFIFTGGICGPLILGLLMRELGSTVAWLTAGAFLLTSAALFGIFRRQYIAQRQPPPW